MRKVGLALLVLVALSAAQSSYQMTHFWGFGYGGFVPANKGTRGMAMGGCYVATSYGHEALLKNPAGLALAKSAEVTVGGRAGVFGSVKDEGYEDNEAIDELTQSFKPDIAINDASFSTNIPLGSDQFTLGAGLGWGSFYDNGLAFEVYVKPKEGDEQTMTLKAKGGVNFLAPAAGFSYAGKYAVGLCFGSALLSQSEMREEYDPGEEQNGTYRANIKGSITQFGLLARPIDALAIGLSYTNGMGITVADPEWEPDEGELQEGEDMDFEIPSQYMLGIGYNLTPQFLVTAEYGNRPLKKIKVEDDEMMDIKDGQTVRAGLEFNPGVALRAGVAMENIMEHAKGGDKKDPASLIVITGGLGIPAGPMTIDAGLEYGMSTIQYDNGEKKYDVSTNLLRIGVNLTYAMDLFGTGGGESAPASGGSGGGRGEE